MRDSGLINHSMAREPQVESNHDSLQVTTVSIDDFVAERTTKPGIRMLPRSLHHVR
jgi:hypothetical protein